MVLAQALSNQANKEIIVPTQVPTSATRVHDFMRMNLLKFHGSKVDKDPIEFIEEGYKVVAMIGVTLEDKVELVACQLKGVTTIW